ncbi:nucleoside phosphorylase domain-containing protein [Aspergillus heterothallicus]
MRTKQRGEASDVEVALICALPLEANAILSLFEEHWTRGLARASDQYSYSFGVLGGCNVVLAHPSGMGKVKAANIAAACAVTFTNIKLALVVGVCGAAPHTETKGDIMLGDVIISKGVFQYDFGRRFPDYFQQKSPLKEPNARIGSLLAKAEADFHRSELENKISQTLSDMETAGAQIYPNEDDRLFLSSYRHKHQEHVDCTLCATCVTDEDAVCKDATESGCNEIGCDPTNLVQRSRCNVKNQPAVQFGYVASGDTVVKSGSYRDRIIQECKVIGFEMEGAAVWDVFPAVVIIKGACDYADSHKNKLWQNYAAATAAACAKAFLQLWQDP